MLLVYSRIDPSSSYLEVMTTDKLENEDILSDSLEFLGGKPVIDDNRILYGPLVLSLAPKV
jgi:nicotinamide N-methyltransferase